MPSSDLSCKSDDRFKDSSIVYPRSVGEHDVKMVGIHRIKLYLLHKSLYSWFGWGISFKTLYVRPLTCHLYN